MHTVFAVIMLLHISDSPSPLPSLPVSEGVPFISISSSNSLPDITYTKGHLQLQNVMHELDKHAENLDRGSYIGYQYSTGQLYQYLLAIHYGDEKRLDPEYSYHHDFYSFEKLVAAYHENVDFTTVQLSIMNHFDSTVEIELGYINKTTKQAGILKYVLSYGIHGLRDQSDFNVKGP